MSLRFRNVVFSFDCLILFVKYIFLVIKFSLKKKLLWNIIRFGFDLNKG